jgi:hypothetical protein
MERCSVRDGDLPRKARQVCLVTKVGAGACMYVCMDMYMCMYMYVHVHIQCTWASSTTTAVPNQRGRASKVEQQGSEVTTHSIQVITRNQHGIETAAVKMTCRPPALSPVSALSSSRSQSWSLTVAVRTSSATVMARRVTCGYSWESVGCRRLQAHSAPLLRGCTMMMVLMMVVVC